jgi:hypothetical protein
MFSNKVPTEYINVIVKKRKRKTGVFFRVMDHFYESWNLIQTTLESQLSHL